MNYKLLKRRIRYLLDYYRYCGYLDRAVNEEPLSNKKVVLFTHELSKTGAPVLLLHMAKWLHRNGWHVIVVSNASGVLIKEFSEYSRVLIARSDRFQSKLKSIREQGFSLAITNSVVTGNWLDSLKQENFKVISFIHELPKVICNWNALSAAKLISNKSDIIIFPSTFVLEKFEELITDKLTNSVILTQGVFLKDEVSAVKKNCDSLCRKVILNVATGNYRKGADLFIDLARKAREYDFIWVGGIDKTILKSKRYTKNKDTNLQIIDYIDDPLELRALYKKANVFALTSREEPFGSVVLESMSCGTPVVGFEDAGGFRDVVINDKTGYLVEKESVMALKNKIDDIVLNPSLASNLSENCIKISKQYNFPKYMERIEEYLLKNLLD